MIKIEANIPIPPRGPLVSKGRPALYPFADMQIGDSFMVPIKASDPQKQKRLAMRVTNAAYANARLHGKKYATRVMDGGVRVWRVA